MVVDNKSSIFNIYKVYILKTASTGSGNCFNEFGQFLAWAWLAKAKGHSYHTKNQLLPKYLRKKERVRVRSTPGHYATKKRSIEITMHLGLDNIIKLMFITNLIDVQN